MALRPSLGLVGLAFLAALPLGAQAPSASREVDELVAWLSGTFDSKEQTDLGGEAPAVRMVTVAVPKSLLSFGAPVLYREEAAVDRPDRPFRQRFFRIEQDAAGAILVRVFELKDPISAAGKWRDASDLGLFGKNDVREREGCLVTFRRLGDEYEGGTTGTRCVSSIRGAAYATSEAKIWRDRIEEWDRGFDGDRKQVWGPVKAPTRFVKRSTDVPGDLVSGAGRGSSPPIVAPPTAPVAPAAPATPIPAQARGNQSSPPPDGDLAIVWIGPGDTVSPEGLRTDRAAMAVRVEEEGATYRGVPLAALLGARGIHADTVAARRLLASALLVAKGADDSVSVFSAEEIFLSKDSYFVVFEKNEKQLGADGPLMLVDVTSPSRNVKRLRSLEWRSLAVSPPGGEK